MHIPWFTLAGLAVSKTWQAEIVFQCIVICSMYQWLNARPSIPSALAMELLQSCLKPSVYISYRWISIFVSNYCINSRYTKNIPQVIWSIVSECMLRSNVYIHIYTYIYFFISTIRSAYMVYIEKNSITCIFYTQHSTINYHMKYYKHIYIYYTISFDGLGKLMW